MILRRWGLLLTLECMFLCVSSQSPSQKRQCAFQIKPNNNKYLQEGNVSGSVQICERTHCCVGYFLIVRGQPEVDVLACNKVEKSCPHATCKPQARQKNLVKCVCNADLCNSNINWTGLSQEPGPTGSVDETWIIIVVLSVALLCFVIVALQWLHLSQRKSNISSRETPQASLHSSPVCSCQTTHTSQMDVTHIQLHQMVARGHFATVWRGTHGGSVVAVKVIPAAMKHAFTSEEEVYGLPLMKHASIICFLGSGRRSHDGSWLIVLQYAEYGSLHSFLCKNTTSWLLSLKMCHSLSQGLCYLHTDLHTQEGHKPPVAHRDLSSFNVLVRADGTCALSDFGCSTILRSCLGHCQTRTTKSHAQAGTLCYMSPEILEGSVNLLSNWCLHADVYALGLLLWEIWMRCSALFQDDAPPQHLLPYQQELGARLTWESLTIHVSHMERRPSIPEHWRLLRQGSALQGLLRECWDCDPDARLTAQCVVDRLVSLHSHYFV
ncbi:anti-Muellerian hormone type-2 receptor-like isoform X2 [Dunckerocampus dactyliophorus]|uniref:anti-Muellerian hormone type-2 receptor-like isoform X2 n=1 Tax=Dunckerocampus dactyliophorus TaxID=161453 RepID=UPI0024057CA2|nr:anti-Muellerian hormone type-2 receptor-like isoform X2 [Dunckerocampus dactyliophorus]XP_054639917.1 anti-Muellerian hormone type-2 receptor-like isoform X2 [Dunckerocampus dactyliophorus]